MAEAIGLVASCAQLIHLSGTLLAGGYSFLSQVSRAPTEMRSLLTEAAAVNSLLSQLQVIADTTPDSAVLDALSTLDGLGVFQECKATLSFIQTALARCQQDAGKDLRNFGRRLAWPFKEKETKDAVQRLHRLRGILANAMEVDSAHTLRRIETGQSLILDGVDSLNTSLQTQISREETQKVLSWLCPVSTNGAQISLENALHRRLTGTGRWFVDSAQFKTWAGAKCSSLWITGLPGSGKTLLCASAIQSIIAHKSENTAVLYFFFDHGDPMKVSNDNLVMTMIRQLLEQSSQLVEIAKKIYDEKSHGGDRPFHSNDYNALLQSFISHFKNVYIMCDALDEATDSDEIASTLESLIAFGMQHDQQIKLLFTGRFDVQLERRHDLITSNRVALSENMKPDIEQYVDVEVSNRIRQGALKLRDQGLRPTIQKHVSTRAGTILHARLQLDYLSTARNDRDLKSMIESLPDGLEHTYETLLQHVTSHSPERVGELRTLLRCLVIASPLLTAANLAEILALQPGQQSLDFDTVATDPYDALDIIAPFVVLSSDKMTHGVVKLSHFSLDEYLRSERVQRSRFSFFHVNEDDGNAWMAEICLQYITLDVFTRSKFEAARFEPALLEQYSFRQYASLNWFRHYKLARNVPYLKDQCEPYLKRLFLDTEGSPCYKRWQEVLQRRFPYDELHRYSPINFAISHGLNDVVDELLFQLGDINVPSNDGYTCLTMAAKWNRPTIIRKLLDLGADIERTGVKQCTPLHLAAEFASRDAFDLLLDAGANPHARSSTESTPFYRACRGGDVHIVRRLKECGCDIDAHTDDFWTPVMEAVENAREEVLDLLLEWGVDLTIRTDQGWTVFLIAEDLDFAPRPSIIEKLRLAAPKDAYEQFLRDPKVIEYGSGTEVAEDEAEEHGYYDKLTAPHSHHAPAPRNTRA